MRLRSWVVLITALLMETTAMANNGYPPRTGGNYNGPRWYGYYANNGFVSANFDHTNMTEIWATYDTYTCNIAPCRPVQLADATTAIINKLAEATKNGEKAMVAVDAIVLIPSNNGSHVVYQNNPNAVADFQNLVQTLISDGYLVPNDPEASTVSSFYVADEPDNNWLNDLACGLGGECGPSPALLNAISAIRQNAATTNFPLAAIVRAETYELMPYGLGLFDWVGLDAYSDSVPDYLTQFEQLESFVHANDVVGGTPQHFFLVPLVSTGVGDTYTNGAPYMQSKFLADNSVIGIMPFRWNNGGTSGMLGTPWASSYIALGNSIAHPFSVEITVIDDYLLVQ